MDASLTSGFSYGSREDVALKMIKKRTEKFEKRRLSPKPFKTEWRPPKDMSRGVEKLVRQMRGY